VLNVATITAALHAQLVAALGSTYQVERAEYINDDPSRCPWVGVYRGGLQLDPQTLGRGSNRWRAQVDLKVVVQAESIDDGAQAEDNLQAYEKAVLAAIDADTTIGGTVQSVIAYSIDYDYVRDERSSVYFQAAIITVTAITKTGG